MEERNVNINDSIQVVTAYLDLLDSQREDAFTAMEGLSHEQIWQRPAPKEWCIGEILDHNYLLLSSILPLVRYAWRFFSCYGRLRRSKPYRTEMRDLYRDDKFPMWVGFVWTPRYHPQKSVPVEKIRTDLCGIHKAIREFYEGKDEDILGHVWLFDPLVGCINLILTLRMGVYHDQLHYDDVIKMANEMKNGEW